jgi:hypothetical protein
MKHSGMSVNAGGLLLQVCLLTGFFIISSYSAPVRPHNISPQRVDPREPRAINAARQLRDHQQRLSVRSKNVIFSKIRHQPATVGISLNKAMRTSSTIFFYDDAEEGINGWTTQSDDGDILWHQTERTANSPTHSWWCGVENQGDYYTGNRVSQSLISPVIDLTGGSGTVTLMFTESYFTEAGWDFCMVDISTDGGDTWVHLRGGYGDSPSGGSDGWKITTLNLTPFAGKQINIRFYFDTGDPIFNAFPGWFVDNVMVYDQAGRIAGTTYFDMNQDGIQHYGEPGMDIGLISVTGPITLTLESAGDFSIPLPLGSYEVSEDFFSRWVQTSSPETWSVDLLSPGQVVYDVNFGAYHSGTLIRGIVFDDLNQDGVKEPTDSLLGGWRIDMSNGADVWVGSASSDDSGRYNLFVSDTGLYHMYEYQPIGWVSTVPGGDPAEYTFDVPRRDTVLDGYLFGSYTLPTGALRGYVFNDVNRNGLLDPLESGLPDWYVSIGDSVGRYYRGAVTDDAGNFIVHDVVIGAHRVSLNLQEEWRQSFPASFYTISLGAGQTIDTLNFGAYALVPSTISGAVFNDMDGDATRDPQEPGLPGVAVHLGGDAIKSAVSDNSGRYTFDGLDSGSYQVRIIMNSHLRQTYPKLFHGYDIDLGDEENITSIDFGMMHDSSFNLAYRTFLPESIAYAEDNTGHLGRPNKAKAYGSEATFDLVVPIGGLSGLHAEFSQAVDTSTLTVTHFPPPKHDIKFKKWEFGLPSPDTLVTGEHVVIFAQGNQGKPLLINAYWWKNGGVKRAPGTDIVKKIPGQGGVLFPMPNVVNVVATIFNIGVPSPGITVGVYGPHSVYHRSYTDVVKSLLDLHGMHSGRPRCLGVFSKGLSIIKKAVKALPPTKGNNILFSEALALKVNIQASDFDITPVGLGELVFQDTVPNSLSGLSVRKIAMKLDTAMSAFDAVYDTCICDSNHFKEFYRTIRMIDSAFSGAMDTISFANGLAIAPTRSILHIPFLHIDSSFTDIANALAHQPKIPEMPRQFVLRQNYPNPFNPSTTIEFYLLQPSVVTLKLYNTLGQEVATLIDRQELDEGWNDFTLSANLFSLASGVYYYRIVAETMKDEDNPVTQKVTMVKKMMFLK